MAKTIVDLQEEIVGKQEVLRSFAGSVLSKSVKGMLEREIDSLKKRIAEILANQVKLGDGSFAQQGQTVFGFVLPMIDQTTGEVVNYALHRRTVQDTKKDTQGIGYVTFQRAEKKFQRLSWYEADRFYSEATDAQQAIVNTLERQREEAQRVLATVGEVVSFVEAHDPTIIDMVDEEEAVTA
jgi:hypothetical protein